MKENFGSKLARALLKPINTSAIVILGVLTFVWGFWLWAPWWDVFSTAKVYSALTFLPEYVWGGVAMIVGVLMCYGVIRHSYRSLTLGALAGFYYWLVMGILFFVGDWHNTAGPVYSFLTIYCAFIWLNIRVNKDNLKL